MDPGAVRDYLRALQARIVAALEALDGARFASDAWKRAEGGGGLTRILEGGELFERAGVGFSDVTGTKLPPSARFHGSLAKVPPSSATSAATMRPWSARR